MPDTPLPRDPGSRPSTDLVVSPPGREPRPSVAVLGWLAELRLAVAFLTRLPIRLSEAEAAAPIGSAARAFPLVGIVVGLAGGLVYLLTDLAGLSTTMGAMLALATTALITGAIHEDGLADTADGLGGGITREHKLTIMRDHRVGSYGVLALIFSVGLRVTALTNTAWGGEGLLLVIAAAAASLACLPTVMYVMTPARTEGLAWSAGRPEQRRVVDAGALGVVIAVLCLGALNGVICAAAGALAAAAAAWFAKRQIGGYTGDVLGAVQQAAEIAILIAFLSSPL